MAFKVLPTIIFFSSFITVLYYLGVLQFLVRGFAWVMMRLLRTSGAESLSASANIFVGQTEAPLLIRPYVAQMTQSELMAVMTGGFATIAGGVLVAYVELLRESFPDIAGHLLAASVMSAPAALVMAKLMIPGDRGEPHRRGSQSGSGAAVGQCDRRCRRRSRRGTEARAEYCRHAPRVSRAVGPHQRDAGAGRADLWGFPQLTLDWILGVLFSPLAWVMGVPWSEARDVGALLGLKTGANEFVAYTRMGEMLAEGGLSERLAGHFRVRALRFRQLFIDCDPDRRHRWHRA